MLLIVKFVTNIFRIINNRKLKTPLKSVVDSQGQEMNLKPQKSVKAIKKNSRFFFEIFLVTFSISEYARSAKCTLKACSSRRTGFESRLTHSLLIKESREHLI